MYSIHHPPFNRHIINANDRINLLKSKSQHRKHTKFKIATWNIRGGLTNTLKCHQVMEEMERLDISVCALQETKAQDIIYEDHPYGHILGFPSTSIHYGSAFAVKKNLQVHSHEFVSDRISVISIYLNNQRNNNTRPSLITVINAYAPQSVLASRKPAEADLFYTQLQATYHKYRNNTLLFIAGDMNAKIGRQLDASESFVGNYSKKYGSRNANGDRLAQFAASNNLFLTNTAFRHPSRHISTWHGTLRNHIDGSLKDYHNQIDYILCRSTDKQILLNARSFRGSIASSDHSVVVTTIDLSKYHARIQPLQKQKNPFKPVQPSALTSNPQLQLRYQTSLQHLITTAPINPTDDPNVQWSQLHQHIITATSTTLPRAVKRPSSHPNYHIDETISTLSNRLRQLRLILERPKSTPYPPGLLRCNYCNERTRIKRLIVKRQHKLHNERLDNIATKLDQCSNSQAAQQFAIAHQLIHNKNKPFQLRDLNSNIPIITPTLQADNIRTHYAAFFAQQDYIAPPIFEPPNTPFIPITLDEVRQAFRRLSNGRTKDSEHLYGEYFKYSGDVLSVPICSIINQIFITQQPLSITLVSQLFCLNKPKGTPTVQNLRPLTLMSIIRKVMELIILHQIYPALDQYISPNQSARCNRSTADILWTYQYQAAYAERYNKVVHFLGIDLTKAFDTVDRTLLLGILEPIVPPSSLIMLQYLMSNTSLILKLGKTTSNPFPTTHGIPQGGALSTLLFAAYMEEPLRHIQREAPSYFRNPTDPTNTIINTVYVDDVEFISTDPYTLSTIDVLLPTFFGPWKLLVNPRKTEWHTINKGSNSSIPKLGSNVRTDLDIKSKFIKATIAFKKLYSLWFRPHLTREQLRIRLYNAFIPPILRYNLHTTGLTRLQMDSMDTFHRKQLRIICRIFYPNHISNKDLYHRCKTAPISIMIIEQRWKLFGHILRLPRTSPPQLSMQQYYIKRPTGRGAPRTTLPVSLNKDLALCDYDPLKIPADLLSFRRYAFRRGDWQRLTIEIINAYKQQYNITQSNRRRSRANVQYGPHLILTPPGHDFRRTNIRLLGSPYTRQNPSPLQPFYNDAPTISP